MISDDRIDALIAQFELLEARLAEGDGASFARLSRDYAALRPVVEQVRAFRALQAEIRAAEALLADPEMRALAQEELDALRRRLPEAERAVTLALLPRDEADARAAIIELRAGTGGEEAALFAADLFRMYSRYAEARGWRVEVMDESPSEMGGLREIVAAVRGEGVFARLKFESGVHRVQRVPATEAQGRIHTSAATVAVLPEAEAVDVEIRSEDIRIDTMRASGAGGQHVNTTDSAVRLTHLPTGIVVTSAEKSQHHNRARAMEVLRARLYDLARREADAARAADRKGQVGSGDRSERIRTYNFPQGRLTDHRINLTLYRLAEVMAGDLDPVIDALAEADRAEKLAAMEA
ncbi:peptide chain release factor 1 [Rubrimonas cliftonensis]|uniref:Peptide chain release factor 1 n=1 Tax=Rubrimonas cliftonensis TaxID=89524 RepID=A0A1H3W018_9RHOB|nr:peptide chain release factor 1 [Rubrimonas cliftonensis]SDZ80485.1 bacterial peptide chain release factor 1 (bRF-1) [Rubrimonas cliftonensis]